MPIIHEEVVDIPTTATVLGVSSPTVRRWIRAGIIQPIQPAGPHGAIRIRRSDIERMLEARPYRRCGMSKKQHQATATLEDLPRFGYQRALWFIGEPKHYLSPDGHRTVTEDEALEEIAKLKKQHGLT